MVAEEELLSWLNRKDKTILENFNFGIKAIKSAEFVLSTKYDIVLKWFSTKFFKIFSKSLKEENEFETIENFLDLKYSINLVTHSSCIEFLNTILTFCLENESNLNHKLTSRKFTEILFRIYKHEIFQNINNDKLITFNKLFYCVLHHYENYLHKTSSQFSLIHEKEFFDDIIRNIKEFVNRIPNIQINVFSEIFKSQTLTKLIEVILTLKENNLKYFDDILEIEKVLFANYHKHIFMIDKTLPIHVHLINFECSLINFRGNVIFYENFIKKTFLFAEQYSEPKQYLMILIYILELLIKHEVGLKFEIDSECAIKYMGKTIQSIVCNHIADNINEVMWLLCSTIKLNPLILEYSILKLAAAIIVSPKSSQEIDMYENFIITLLEMFKNLNRSEKYVSSLFKALNEHLKENKISKSIKRKSSKRDNVESPHKKIKMEYNNYVELVANQKNESLNWYFKILIKDVQNFKVKSMEITKNLNENQSKELIKICSYSSIVGKEFSKFISTLTSRTALVIWQTILFNLKELIEILCEHKASSELDETILFKLDFTSELLTQYFSGSKLVEHYDKFTSEIEKNIKFTKTILKEFGQFVLDIEHNNRIVNDFLQLVQNFGMFCLIIFYYPSINEIKETINNSKTIYEFLSSDEWILIEQRIANFGDVDTKYNMNMLSLQKLDAKILSQNNITSNINITTVLSSSTFSDPEQITKILLEKNNKWLIKTLFETEKNTIRDAILENLFENKLNVDFFKLTVADHDCLKIIIIALYEYFGKIIGTKKSVLYNIDFNQYKSVEHKNKIEIIVEKLDNTPNKAIKNLESDKIVKNLNVFNLFNFASCEQELKIEMFALHLALYRDLLNTTNDSLIEEVYKILENFLYFKPSIKICDYISFENLTKIISPLSSRKFYQLLFQTNMKNDDEYSIKFLTTVLNYLKSEKDMSEEQIKLNLILIEILHEFHNKTFKSIKIELLQKFENYVFNHMIIHQNSKDNEKLFVENTLAAFSIYLNYALVKADKKEFEITDDFRKFCKIYIAYSVNYSSEYSIRLITTALNNCERLHFDPDEIQLILEKYWEQIKTKLQMTQEGNIENLNNEKYYKDIMNLIVGKSSNTKFRDLLLEIEKDTKVENVLFICRVIKQISKLQLNKIKSAILNEYFKKISLQVLFKLEKDCNQQFINYNLVLNLLSTMKSLCENREIPLSLDHVDGILTFLIDINIKKFILTDNNENIFKDLHDEMINLCLTLIKSRHEIISDRIPQFTIIYQDLIQSICWYKSERQKNVVLNENDLQELAKLAAKLENLMHLLAKNELNLKRVAPYLLTFIIDLMVNDKRSTTLYTKIKTHMESICYMLIKICDHRVGPFILRCTNDATRHVYQNLVKEYKKYHKFKGKV